MSDILLQECRELEQDRARLLMLIGRKERFAENARKAGSREERAFWQGAAAEMEKPLDRYRWMVSEPWGRLLGEVFAVTATEAAELARQKFPAAPKRLVTPAERNPAA